MSQLYVVDCGIVSYTDGLALQERLVEARFADKIPDTLLLLEHPPVYTVGKKAQTREGELTAWENMFTVSRETIGDIEIHPIYRGGHITYHGPGQLVGYPIRRLEQMSDFGTHLQGLEETMYRSVCDFGLNAYRSRVDDDPQRRDLNKIRGVWFDVDGKPHKLGAVGAGIRRRGKVWTTFHGFALNVTMDLEPFSWIYPCGHPIEVTSMSEASGRTVPLELLKDPTVTHFSDIFLYGKVESKTLDDLFT